MYIIQGFVHMSGANRRKMGASMLIEGYISKKNIKRWLENYEALVAGDRPYDAIPTNAGRRLMTALAAGV
jgi:hypothetical protein